MNAMTDLTRKDLLEAFGTLGTQARKDGMVIDIAVYGGSCLMLASNFRQATKDVDAVTAYGVENQRYIDRLAGEIAAQRGWPQDWLNDGVRTFLSPNVELFEQHEPFGSYPSEDAPGLRVFIPKPEYLLAMKLMAMRVDAATGGADLEDILNLLQVVGPAGKQDIVELAAGFYPEARVSGKLLLSLDHLWSAYESRERQNRGEPPRYPGGSGPKIV